MVKSELIKQSPLRILDASMNGGIGKGNVGVLAARHGVTVLNAPGTIDADYRGEIGVILINHGDEPFTVERGMRIAQMVVAPVVAVTLHLTSTLPETARGSGGFGSTGR